MKNGSFGNEIYVFDKSLIKEVGALVEKNVCYVEILFTWQFDKETRLTDRKLYDWSFKVFHYAFSLGERGRSYLWFMLDTAGEELNENLFDKSDFGSGEWEFFKKFCTDEWEMLKNCLSNTKK